MTSEDFHLGYCLTGVLERSVRKYDPYQVTHLAFVKRKTNTNSTSNASAKSAEAAVERTDFRTIATKPVVQAESWPSSSSVTIRNFRRKIHVRKSHETLADRILRRLCRLL